MERQKGRLQSHFDAAQNDLDSIVKKLTKKLKDTGKVVAIAVGESNSKKFKKAHEKAKKDQQALEDTLDKIASVLEGEASSSEGDDEDEGKDGEDGNDDDDEDDDIDDREESDISPRNSRSHSQAAAASSVPSTAASPAFIANATSSPLPPSVLESVELGRVATTLADLGSARPIFGQVCNPSARRESPQGPDEKDGVTNLAWEARRQLPQEQPRQDQHPQSIQRLHRRPSSASSPLAPSADGPTIVKRLYLPVLSFPFDSVNGVVDEKCFRFLFSVIESPGEFYAIPIDSSHVEDMERLVDGLDAFYGAAAATSSISSGSSSLMIRLRGGGDGDSSAGSFLSSARVGDVVVAKYRVDGRFYRGVVREIRGRQFSATQQCQNPEFFVFYFDYGNSDWVVADDVWPLVQEFASSPPLCVRCRLIGRGGEPLLPPPPPPPRPVAAAVPAEGWTKVDGERMSDSIDFRQWYRAYVVDDDADDALDELRWAERTLNVAVATCDGVFIDEYLVQRGVARYGGGADKPLRPSAMSETHGASVFADHGGVDDLVNVSSKPFALPFYSSQDALLPGDNAVHRDFFCSPPPPLPLISSPSTTEFVERFRTPELSEDDHVAENLNAAPDAFPTSGASPPAPFWNSPDVEVREDGGGDDMAKDWRSSKNVYGRDVGELGDRLSLLNMSEMRKTETCPYWRKGKCLLMDCRMLHREHTEEEKRVDPGLIAADCVIDGHINDEPPPVLIPGEWYVVEVSSVKTPSHFYIHLPFGDRPLSSFDTAEDVPGVFVATLAHRKDDGCDIGGGDGLRRGQNDELSPMNLGKFFRGRSHAYRLDYALLRPGELVAVKWGPEGGVYRARVIKIDDERGKLRVNFVDYGNTLSVAMNGDVGGEGGDTSIMRLPAQLLHRGFRAVECHLAHVGPSTIVKGPTEEDGIESRENDFTWSRGARDFFVDLVEAKTLVAQVRSLLLEGVPVVDLWDTTAGLMTAEMKPTASLTTRPVSPSLVGSSDVLLNELLVRRGFGRRVDSFSEPR